MISVTYYFEDPNSAGARTGMNRCPGNAHWAHFHPKKVDRAGVSKFGWKPLS